MVSDEKDILQVSKTNMGQIPTKKHHFLPVCSIRLALVPIVYLLCRQESNVILKLYSTSQFCSLWQKNSNVFPQEKVAS